MSLATKVNALYNLIRLSRYYGPLYPFTRTGRINVFDYSFPFYCRPSQYYLAENAAGSCYEPAACSHMIKRYGGRKITFLDIGAYYGIFASLIGVMNPENQVYAFEPNPLFFRTLEKNWKMNCRNGGCFQIALSDSEGSIPFQDRSMKVSASDTTLRVPAMRYEAWQKENPIKPDVIKLDVHGSEGMVLFGMQDLLKEGGFDLYFELHPEEILTKYSLREIITLLYDSGWEMSELPDFRDLSEAELVPINSGRRAILEDPLKWTQKEYDSRRMFFCRKSKSS